MIKVAIVGFGSRGQMFAGHIHNDAQVQLFAVADPVACNRERAEAFGVPPQRRFEDAEAFFACGRLCDAVFICTQDAQHAAMAVRAMELGYDICLEKPAAVNIDECIAIRDTAERLGRKVMLTHVLRYSPFYGVIKDLIDGGTLGDIAVIDQTENIAYWHFALSYVRGPWRSMKDSSCTIIAKCCHDTDILNYLMPYKCVSVSSYGQLFHFRPENAPAGSAEWCADCDEETKSRCLYNAYSVYPQRLQTSVVGGTARLRDRDIYEVLDGKQDVIGRCVYRGDNDAIDNQVVNMQFENGAAAHLTMTAFSQECYRCIHVHGTKGEVHGNADTGILHLTVFGQPEQVIDVNTLTDRQLNDGHGGGDYFLYKDFIDYITAGTPSRTRTTIADSIESHLIGFKAEESRLAGGRPMRIG